MQIYTVRNGLDFFPYRCYATMPIYHDFLWKTEIRLATSSCSLFLLFTCIAKLNWPNLLVVEWVNEMELNFCSFLLGGS